MNMRSILAPSLVSVLIFAGCAVTNIRSQIDSNPLQTIAEKASDKYSVTWINENTLQVSDWWPVHSILCIGYTAFHANLRYSAHSLEGDYYLQSNCVWWLFISTRVDAGPALWGIALKPYMRSQIDEILGYAGSSMEASTVTHGKSKSVIE